MLVNTVYIGLGSNLQSPKQHVIQALQEIHGTQEIFIQACSHLYESVPMGPQDQPNFINAVCKVATSLTPLALLDKVQEIEERHKRVRNNEKWGPRTLDLDLLLYNQLKIEEPRLKVPHYGMHERQFVLIPMFEIEPDMIMPDGRSLASWINLCELSGLKRLEDKIDYKSLAA
ncbi:MAG: 2-amino-4-hydroxy-6-hydroxymethyldihydropteridine diphosphokinase [Pseudomonadota bacterium]